MPPDMAIDVIERDQGACAVCGLHIDGKGHIHHRKPRGMGGSGEVNVLSNLIYLHPSCHLKHVESQRQRAFENGWILQRWQDSQEQPLMYRLDRWVILTDDGHIVEIGDNTQ